MKFNCKTLQNSFELAQPILERLKPLDALSEDIQKLEHVLGSVHLQESFVFNLNFIHTPRYEEELLIWQYKQQRIIYIKNRYKVTCLSHVKGYYQHINYNDKETLLEMPLMEAPAEVKKHLAEQDKLALFLSLLTEQYTRTSQAFHCSV